MAAVAAAGLLAGAGAEAQTLMCGSSACADPLSAAWNVVGSGPDVSTGIDDLKLGGGYWDVRFTQTQPSKSPFVLSTTAAAPGQPLTGIDASEALLNWYGSTAFYGAGTDPFDGPALVTAFGRGKYPAYDFSNLEIGPFTTATGGIIGPSHGYSNYLVAEYPHEPPQGLEEYTGVAYTVWTPVAAPTMQAPELNATGLSGAATLLIAGLALLRGRRATGGRALAASAVAVAGALGAAGAQAQTLMCGKVACSDPWDAAWNVSGSGPDASTEIDDLKVGGGYWDVRFTQKRPSKSPFVLAQSQAAPGQPLTGFDANEALLDFYGSLPNGGPGSDPHDGPALITAFGPGNYYGSKTAGYDIAYLDIGPYTLPNGVNTGPSHGYSEYVAAEYVNEPISALAWSGSGAAYTVWTPVAAPTMQAPELNATGLSGAATLLAVGVALMRGRRVAG